MLAYCLRNRRFIVSVVGAAVIVLLDAVVHDLAALFGLCGSLGLGTIPLILPAFMILRERQRYAATTVLGAGAVLVVGLVVTVGCSVCIIGNIA